MEERTTDTNAEPKLDNNPSVKFGKCLANPEPGEEVCISGMSGTLPFSDNIEEYKNNLFNKVNMITHTPKIHPEIPTGQGRIKDLKRFDTGFFGVHKRHAVTMEPGFKILLEKSIECVLDAGLNPKDLEGTNTGVFIGYGGAESQWYWWCENQLSGGDAIVGNMGSICANRISYYFKTKGPSLTCDVACSSAAFGLEKAYYYIRTGQLENAFVLSASIILSPRSTLRFARLGVLSPEGISRPFDEEGNGYVRSDATACVFLQKAKNCKRIYAKIFHTKVSNDGYKEQGITYPSGEDQYNLLRETYFECGINPKDVNYVEAHCTGTQVGDPEEVNCIDRIFTKSRDKPILVGSVKSNIGHSETAAALCSLLKVLLTFEQEIIPPNINYKNPRKNCAALQEGRLKVVEENTPFNTETDFIGLNSFGFGGGNFHMVLKGNPKNKINDGKPQDDLPRLVCVSGRTKEAVRVLLDDIVKNFDVEHIGLLHNIFRKPIANHLYKGYTLVHKARELKRSIKQVKPIKLFIYFGGLSNNLINLVEPILQLHLLNSFKSKLELFFNRNKIDLKTILAYSSSSNWSRFLAEEIGQLVIAELLKQLQIESKNVFAQSFGELSLAYFKGYLKLEEILDFVLVLGKITNEMNIYKNGSPINLDVFQTQRHKIILEFQKLLNSTKVSNECNGYINNDDNYNFNYTRNLSVEQVLDSVLQNDHTIYSCIPKNSIILEIGQSLSLVKKGYNVLTFNGNGDIKGVLEVIGSLYENGLQPQIQRLYSSVQFPVSRKTPMISSKIAWKHDHEYFVCRFEDKNVLAGEVREFKIVSNLEEWSACVGHIIDGRNLFPATGYLFIVWTTFVDMEELPFNRTKVVFENCKFRRACTIPKEGVALVLTVLLQRVSGNFEILEGDVPVVTGNIKVNEEDSHLIPINTNSEELDNETILLNSKDIYKELRLRGYNYRGLFRGLTKCNKKATIGEVSWNDSWIAFMDNMLQIKILAVDSRLLYVPVSIAKLSIDPEMHLKNIEKLKEEKEFNALNNPSAEQTKEKTTNSSVSLPIYVNTNADIIRSGGIECKGLLASSIPRKKYTGIPVLETYQFVPNNMKLSILSSIRVFMQIALENNCGIKIKAVEVIDEASETNLKPLIPVVQEVLADQPLVQSDATILSTEHLDVDVKVEKRKLKYENDCTLLIASRLSKRSEVLREAIKATSDLGFIISRETLTVDLTPFNQSNLTVLNISETNGEKLVLLKKPTAKSSKPTEYVNVNTTEKRFNWLEKLKEPIKNGNDLVVWAQNEPLNGILGLVNCIKREPGGQNVRSVFIMDKAPPFDPNNAFYKEQLDKNMGVNVYENGQWGTYRHLLLDELEELLKEHCFVNNLVRGDLSSLKWIEGPLTRDYKLENGKTLVEIYYASLNFKDVMTASGRINIDMISEDRREQECVLGIEFSGRTLCGKRVMGMAAYGCLATLASVDDTFVYNVPDHWSLKEAATVPAVYSTVLYSLVTVGRIKSNNSILIHSGTGGIGQAAINLCLAMGCTIYTTVGTEEKKEFIKKHFPEINEKHIGNSRDVSFEQMIMKATNGKGVDFVLNSLAEEKLFTSVRCLAENGTFLEIGKYDLVNNNFMNLLSFKKGVTYHGIMLDRILNGGSLEEKKIVTSLVQKYIDEDAIKPLMTTNVFPRTEVEDAFRFMATGKHMGKVLIRIREEVSHATQLNNTFRGIPRYFCDPEKCYIICGGLGGFGLELADWLILRGAKNLLLTSRRGISTGYQSYRIGIWQSYGCKINISTKDITTKDGCMELIREASTLAPVHAIFNLAVILKDAILENQSEETFTISFGPKADATYLLDEVSRDMCPELRDFVVFSSVSCGRGNAGQSNYGMANSVMERICEKRRNDGFPALAIEWGAVGDVGLVAEMQEEHIELEIGGTLQQRIANCLEVLDILLKQNQAAIVSSMVVAEKRAAASSGNIVEVICGILGIRDLKAISMNATLAELGMDSMNGVEIKQTLEREYNLFLTPTELRNLTFKRIQEIYEEHNTKSEENKKTEISLDLEEVFQHLESFESVDKSNTPYVNLEVNTNNKETSELPRFIALPGIEGVCTKVQNLIKKLEVEAFGITYFSSEQKDTIVETAEQLLPHIVDLLQPGKPFNLLAHSVGSIIALELVSKLEKLGYFGSLYLVDGAPALMTEMVTSQWGDEQINYDYMENYILAACLKVQLPIAKVEEIMVEVNKCSSLEEKINSGAKYVQFDTEFTLDHMRCACQALFKRLKAAKTYTPSFDKLKSKVILFKPTTPTVQRPMSEDYDLGQYCQDPVEVKVFEGNHNSILENEDLASFISNCLSEKIDEVKL